MACIHGTPIERTTYTLQLHGDGGYFSVDIFFDVIHSDISAAHRPTSQARTSLWRIPAHLPRMWRRASGNTPMRPGSPIHKPVLKLRADDRPLCVPLIHGHLLLFLYNAHGHKFEMIRNLKTGVKKRMMGKESWKFYSHLHVFAEPLQTQSSRIHDSKMGL